MQDQYVKDFSKHLIEIKGRNNYTCSAAADLTCDEGPGAITAKLCMSCPYMIQKKMAEQAHTALMNFSYYMTVGRSGSFHSRDLLIVDEAHNLAEQLVSFAQVIINNKMLKRLVGSDYSTLEIPQYDNLKDYERWLEDLLDIVI